MSASNKERRACPVCHNTVDSDSKRCSHCGATLESKNKIFKDFVNRWEKIEGASSKKGTKKKCPLCGIKLRVPPFKCKACKKYYEMDEIVRASEGMPKCPKCKSQVELCSEKDLESGVKLEKCRECGYDFMGDEGLLSLFYSSMAPYLLHLMHTPPTKIEIDGKFGDWRGVTTTSDDNEGPAFNPNVDIVDYRVDGRQVELSFYLKVAGSMLAGEPGGERHVDTAYIFIDSDRDSETGYFIWGLGADFMLKIYGWDQEIMRSSLNIYDAVEQDWNLWEVWSNGYVGVYHMIEETGSAANSATSTNDGTKQDTEITQEKSRIW